MHAGLDQEGLDELMSMMSGGDNGDNQEQSQRASDQEGGKDGPPGDNPNPLPDVKIVRVVTHSGIGTAEDAVGLLVELASRHDLNTSLLKDWGQEGFHEGWTLLNPRSGSSAVELTAVLGSPGSASLLAPTDLSFGQDMNGFTSNHAKPAPGTPLFWILYRTGSTRKECPEGHAR